VQAIGTTLGHRGSIDVCVQKPLAESHTTVAGQACVITDLREDNNLLLTPVSGMSQEPGEVGLGSKSHQPHVLDPAHNSILSSVRTTRTPSCTKCADGGGLVMFVAFSLLESPILSELARHTRGWASSPYDDLSGEAAEPNLQLLDDTRELHTWPPLHCGARQGTALRTKHRRRTARMHESHVRIQPCNRDHKGMRAAKKGRLPKRYISSLNVKDALRRSFSKYGCPLSQ